MASNGIDILAKKASELELGDDSQENVPFRYPPFMDFDAEMPPAPKIDRSGIVVTDITEGFLDAAMKLDTGELIKDGYFTLFEAVSAIEIMDPKMDSGYLAPGDTLEDDYDIKRDLLPEEVIGIIDQLICHEMAWHTGHPLSQTIFTSLYIEHILQPKPKNIEITRFDGYAGSYKEESMVHRTLRAYCLGLLKTCSYVNNRVKAEHYYEEEDFVTHTYTRSLLEEVKDQDVLDFLKDTIERFTSETYQSSDSWKAVLDRLQFRIAFLETVAEASADTRDATAISLLWDRLIETLPAIKNSTDLGKPVPESFSAKLQRKLASTVPPRPIVQTSFETAFQNLEQLCRDGKDVVQVLEYHDSHSLMTFVSIFQARKPQPPVLIRTLLQNFLFGENKILGKHSIRQLLDDDLSSVVLPADQLLDRSNDEIEHPADPRHQMAQKMEIFRMRAANSYLDILRSLCQNRCRIRRSLCHAITDWDNLQLDGEELDQQLREFTKEEPIIDHTQSFGPIFAFPLSSWAYFHKLRLMELIVQLGFELEIYQPDELSGMYWYLHFLSSTRIRHLERIRGFVMRKFAASGRAKHTTIHKDKDFGKTISFLNLSMLEATATENFADALTCFYTVLKRLSLLPTPTRPYSTDAQRYELRMKPFFQIVLPELPPFSKFTEYVTQESETTQELLEIATLGIGKAKKDFELLSKMNGELAFCVGSEKGWKDGVKNCLRATIAAGLAISMVKKVVDGGGDVEGKLRVEVPGVEKGYHDWWIVPKVLAGS